MKRTYQIDDELPNEQTDEQTEEIRFFVGYEVEHIPTWGKKTLFVVGIQPAEDVIEYALEEKVEAISFGANQSFELSSLNEWEKMITPCLEHSKRFWCVLDYDVIFHTDVLETTMIEAQRFVPIISIKLPFIKQLPYHAWVKIDDRDFESTNPGVWLHRVHDLQDNRVFTSWSEFVDNQSNRK